MTNLPSSIMIKLEGVNRYISINWRDLSEIPRPAAWSELSFLTESAILAEIERVERLQASLPGQPSDRQKDTLVMALLLGALLVFVSFLMGPDPAWAIIPLKVIGGCIFATSGWLAFTFYLLFRNDYDAKSDELDSLLDGLKPLKPENEVSADLARVVAIIFEKHAGEENAEPLRAYMKMLAEREYPMTSLECVDLIALDSVVTKYADAEVRLKENSSAIKKLKQLAFQSLPATDSNARAGSPMQA